MWVGTGKQSGRQEAHMWVGACGWGVQAGRHVGARAVGVQQSTTGKKKNDRISRNPLFSRLGGTPHIRYQGAFFSPECPHLLL